MSSVERKPVWRWRGPVATAADDEIAREEPLEILVNGRAVSVTMRTPGHDQELAAGFLLSEGIIAAGGDIASIEPALRRESCNSLNVRLREGVAVDHERLTRHVFASSSCGLCGKASIEAVHQHFAPVDGELTVAPGVLAELPRRLRRQQATFDRTGGLHAAAVFDAGGALVVAREDVGRHNAVDKILGYGMLNQLDPYGRHVLMVSGRASFEIVQKALAGRVAVVAAVSAPSSLAIEFAEASGQTLIGFLRGDAMNVYTHPERVRVG